MKFLFITNNPNLGSTARALQVWLRELVRSGNVVKVVCPQGSLARALRDLGCEVKEGVPRWPDRWRPWRGSKDYLRLAWWARDVDVVHCNEHNVYPIGAALRLLLRRPTLCHVRFDVGRPFCEWIFGRYGTPDALLWTSQDQMSRCSPAVAGLVPIEKQYLVPLGLDLEHFGHQPSARDTFRTAYGITSDQFVVGTASAFKPIKRLEDFVSLIVALRNLEPHVVGVIAGGRAPGFETYYDEIVKQIEQHHATGYIKLIGNQEEMEPVMQGLDLFVSTSELETFGNSVCEAMACGVPVVAYRGGSIAEVVGDTGRIVENGDLAGLIKQTQELLSDAHTRLALGTRARDRVMEKFDAKDRLPIY